MISSILAAYQREHAGSTGYPTPTSSGLFAASEPRDVIALFEKLGDRRKRFLDLGSGDGMVVLLASQFFRHAQGVEIDVPLHEIATHIVSALDIPNVSFFQEDFLSLDLSPFDVIYIAPDAPFTMRLEEKLRRELSGTLIVYSTLFYPRTLVMGEEIRLPVLSARLYTNTATKV